MSNSNGGSGGGSEIDLSDVDLSEVKFEYYRYDPSMAAAVIFIVLFVLTTGMHTFQLVKKRTWYFIPFVLGGFCKLEYFPPLLLESLPVAVRPLLLFRSVRWSIEKREYENIQIPSKNRTNPYFKNNSRMDRIYRARPLMCRNPGLDTRTICHANAADSRGSRLVRR